MNLLSFEEFKDSEINEAAMTMSQEASNIPKSDAAYHFIFSDIAAHIGCEYACVGRFDGEDNLEIFENITGSYVEGRDTTISTAIKGNFVLNCGTSSYGPTCKLWDQLDKIISFYIKIA